MEQENIFPVFPCEISELIVSFRLSSLFRELALGAPAIREITNLRLTCSLFDSLVKRETLYIGYGNMMRKYVKISLHQITGWGRHLLKEQCNIRVNCAGYLVVVPTRIRDSLASLMLNEMPPDTIFADSEDRNLIKRVEKNSGNFLKEAFKESEEGRYFTLHREINLVSQTSLVRCANPDNPTEEWHFTSHGKTVFKSE